MIEIASKTAEKNSAQTNKQTDRQTNRHYENNGHLAVNQKLVVIHVGYMSTKPKITPEKTFACRVVRYWKSLSIEVVDFSTLNRFQQTVTKADFPEFLS